MKSITRFALVLSLILMLAFSVLPVMAQEAEPGAESPPVEALPAPPSDVVSFVAFLALNSLAIVASLEKLPQYQSLTAAQKSIFTFALVVVVLPIGSDVLQTFLGSLQPEVLTVVNKYFALLVAGWYSWSGMQYGYPALKWLTAGSKTT